MAKKKAGVNIFKNHPPSLPPGIKLFNALEKNIKIGYFIFVSPIDFPNSKNKTININYFNRPTWINKMFEGRGKGKKMLKKIYNP